MAQLIVLNGGSSSGKSGIARCLQVVLPDPWLALSVDTLVEALPASTRASPAVTASPEWPPHRRIWSTGEWSMT
jgi:chloramphenicol 3-O phosphotransferase